MPEIAQSVYLAFVRPGGAWRSAVREASEAEVAEMVRFAAAALTAMDPQQRTLRSKCVILKDLAYTWHGWPQATPPAFSGRAKRPCHPADAYLRQCRLYSFIHINFRG